MRHDALFRSVFGQPRHAISHLSRFLPAEVLAELRIEEATPYPGTVVDAKLKEHHADLIYRVPLRHRSHATLLDDQIPDEALLFMLFEHQSTLDPLMALRLLRYMTAVWDNYLRQTKAALLPPTVAVVLYHGERPWDVSPHFTDIVAFPPDRTTALHLHVPSFSYIVNDLSSIPDEVLQAGALDGLVRLLFKYSRDDLLSQKLPEWVALFDQVAAEGTSGLQGLSLVVEYLMQGRRVPPQVIDIIGELVSAEVRQIFKSTADLLREEGEARGRAEGRAEGEARGRAKDILRILAAHRLPVSSDLEALILGCHDLAQLDRWFDRALTARTIDDVLRDD
jgi:predicted transposase YdaD